MVIQIKKLETVTVFKEGKVRGELQGTGFKVKTLV